MLKAFSSAFVSTQVSAPYITVGRITFLQVHIFIPRDINYDLSNFWKA
jgi:hypothetical protein